jgi:hypothetical protein
LTAYGFRREALLRHVGHERLDGRRGHGHAFGCHERLGIKGVRDVRRRGRIELLRSRQHRHTVDIRSRCYSGACRFRQRLEVRRGDPAQGLGIPVVCARPTERDSAALGAFAEHELRTEGRWEVGGSEGLEGGNGSGGRGDVEAVPAVFKDDCGRRGGKGLYFDGGYDSKGGGGTADGLREKGKIKLALRLVRVE